MTVRELIEELVQLDGNTEVRFASQPRWPFEYSIRSVIVAGIEDRQTEEITDVVYLEEGRQIGYLPSEAKDKLMW
jgi:hypothetical protein